MWKWGWGLGPVTIKRLLPKVEDAYTFLWKLQV